MTEKKRKALFWLFKIAGIFVSCALPIWAVYEYLPIWARDKGFPRTISVCGIIVIFILLIVFRKTVFDFLMHKLKLQHAPPLFIWLLLIAISYVLVFIGNFAQDLVIVFWMGFIGSGIGTFLTYISNRFEADGEDKK